MSLEISASFNTYNHQIVIKCIVIQLVLFNISTGYVQCSNSSFLIAKPEEKKKYIYIYIYISNSLAKKLTQQIENYPLKKQIEN